MFRKIAILSGLLMALAGTATLHAALSDNPLTPDIVGWGADRDTAPIVGINYYGDILPGRNNSNDIGNSTTAFKDIYARSVNMTGGNVTCQYWRALSSASLTGGGGNSTGVGFTVSSRTLAEGPTTYTDIDIDQSSGAARNVTLYFASSTISGTIGVLSTTTLIASATIYGYDSKGNFTSELIFASTNNPVALSTSTIAITGNGSNVVSSVGIGNVAWMYISSFTVQITSMTDSFGLNVLVPILRLGYGDKIGLPGNIDSLSDVIKVQEAGGSDASNVLLFPALSINTVYDTIYFPTELSGLGSNDRTVCVNRRHSN